MNAKKAVYLLIIVFLVAGGVRALAYKDKSGEEILNLDSATLRYDFGVVEKDSVIKKTLTIRNALNRAIEIKSAQSTCECISAILKPQKVKRGGVFEVEITFDSSGLDKHQYLEEVVYILTSDKDYELIRLVALVEAEGK